MTDFILKSTNCDNFCDFKNVMSFCLECPALMCSKCKISMHPQGKDKHEIIDFKNEKLDWNDKDIILDIFDDKNLGEDVFNMLSLDASKYTSEIGTGDLTCINKWTCTNCTYLNEVTLKECKMCFFKRESIDTDYDLKLKQFNDNMRQNFQELDEIHSINPLIPFENIAIEYLRNNPMKLPMSEWYPTYYPKRKYLNLVNDIIEEKGFDIGLSELNQEYEKRAEKENEKFINSIQSFGEHAELMQRFKVLELKDANKLNVMPENFMCLNVEEKEIWDAIFQDNFNNKQQCRMLITEMDLNSSLPLIFLQSLLADPEFGDYLRESSVDGNVKLIHLKQAISEQKSIDMAFSFLRNQCKYCYLECPKPEMLGFIMCEHEFCKTCFMGWLRVAILVKNPTQWNCPECEEDKYLNIDRNMHYGQLRTILGEDQELNKIFEGKLFQDHVRDSKNFHWCANEKCTYGFEAEGLQKILCPICKIDMCVNCNRVWQAEHVDKTCQEFEMWMLNNNHDLANLLNNIGIECPKCRMRYALAPGGCLHFNCNTCQSNFCGGCYQFMFKNTCGDPRCTLAGLHGHHPRNCYYYLRDYEVARLEEMLKNQDYTELKGKPEQLCPFIKTTEEMNDYPCNEQVYASTGLCQNHYKEYLIQFINRLKIDPADFANLAELKLMWFQALEPSLDKQNDETENAFAERLKKKIKEQFKLYIPNNRNAVN